MAAETVIESFCERCGTRYTFEPVRKRESKLVGLGKQLGILLEDHAGNLAQRDPFHGTFHFCLECRQYTCPRCWNEAAGFCLGCMPLPGAPDTAALDAAEVEAGLEAAVLRDEASAEHDLLSTPDAWPDADLLRHHAAVDAWPEAALVAEPTADAPTEPEFGSEPGSWSTATEALEPAEAATWDDLESDAALDISALAQAADTTDAQGAVASPVAEPEAAADAGVVWFDETADAAAAAAVLALGTSETDDVPAEPVADTEPVQDADGDTGLAAIGTGAIALLAVAGAVTDDPDDAETDAEVMLAGAHAVLDETRLEADAADGAELAADVPVLADSDAPIFADADSVEAVAEVEPAEAEPLAETIEAESADAEPDDLPAEPVETEAAEAAEFDTEALAAAAEPVETEAAEAAEIDTEALAAAAEPVETEAAEAAEIDTEALAAAAEPVETEAAEAAALPPSAEPVTADADDEADWADLIRHLPPAPDDEPWTDDWSAMAPSLGPDIAAIPDPAAPEIPVAAVPAPTPAPAIAWQLTPPLAEAEPRATAWPPLGPVFRPAPTPPPAAPHPSVLTPRPASGGLMARGQSAGSAPGALPNGVRPCRNCELPLSASARFCRRCGRPQA